MLGTQDWIVRKRDGRSVAFEMDLISNAIAKAFRAELNLADGQSLDSEIEQEIAGIACIRS